jgi:hypothetical protein
MLQHTDGARFPPDMTVGIQAKEFNLGFRMHRLHLNYCYSAIWVVNFINSEMSWFIYVFLRIIIICVLDWHFTASLGASNISISLHPL